MRMLHNVRKEDNR